MIGKVILVQGEEFITKLLNGERDFSNIRLEPYFNLSGNDYFENLQEYLKQSNLKETPVILEHADLKGLDADGLHLPYLKANEANFKHVSMMETNLKNSQFNKADFRYAKLPQTNMEGANLQEADLRQVDLNLARLNKTVLTGANFTGANLLFTNMHRANIKGIVNLEQARAVDTVNFQFVALTKKEKAIIRRELWAQPGKRMRLFGGSG